MVLFCFLFLFFHPPHMIVIWMCMLCFRSVVFLALVISPEETRSLVRNIVCCFVFFVTAESVHVFSVSITCGIMMCTII
jgi:hypothetical protein